MPSVVNAKSKEALLLQSVWRRALREGEVVVEMPSESDAKRLRFSLYNAVRDVRQGKVVDAELLQATQECSIQITGTTVVVQGKTRSAMMQAVLSALGGTEESVLAEAQAPKTVEEVEVAESQKRLLEKLGEGGEVSPDSAPRTTPYYSR